MNLFEFIGLEVKYVISVSLVEPNRISKLRASLDQTDPKRKKEILVAIFFISNLCIILSRPRDITVFCIESKIKWMIFENSGLCLQF